MKQDGLRLFVHGHIFDETDRARVTRFRRIAEMLGIAHDGFRVYTLVDAERVQRMMWVVR